jgi:hypothetical protein
MRIATMLFVAATVVASGSVVAAEKSEGPLQRRLDPTQFPQLVELVRNELRPGGRYGLLHPREREQVEKGLAQMLDLLEGRRSVDELGLDEQVALVNAQERVNGLLTKRDRDRLICTHQRTLGTHRKHVVCQTYGEVIARRETSREEQRKLMQREQLCRELSTGPVQNSGNAGSVCY